MVAAELPWGLADAELVDPVVLLDCLDPVAEEEAVVFLDVAGGVEEVELFSEAEVVELVVVSALGFPPALVMYDSTLPGPEAGELTPSTIPFLHWSPTEEKK